MNWLLRTLLLLIAFGCAMRSWQFYAGIRLMIYDLALVGFIAVYGLRFVTRRRVPRPVSDLRNVLVMRWLVLLLSLATIAQLDFQLAPASTSQFAKGIGSLLLYAAGLSAIVLYLWEAGSDFNRSVMRAFLWGVAASCVFSFFEVSLAYFGYDLAKVVFRAISIYPPDFDWSAPFYYEWDGFFRAKGFTGVNAQATYAVSGALVVLLASPFRRRWLNGLLLAICLAGSAVTLSRNGFFTLCIALGIHLLFKPRLVLRVVPALLLALVPILVVVGLYSESAVRLIGTRTYTSLSEFGRGRWEIYDAAWATVGDNPLGHGVNQFSVIIQLTKQIDITEIELQYSTKSEEEMRAAYANLHNNWVNWLFEGGWPLLAAWLAYYGLILRVFWRSDAAGFAGFAILSSLAVSGFFNMTLDLFSTELLVILLMVGAARTRAEHHMMPAAMPDATPAALPT